MKQKIRRLATIACAVIVGAAGASAWFAVTRASRCSGGRSTDVSVVDAFDRRDDATTLGRTDTGQRWTSDGGRWGVRGSLAYITSATAARVLAIPHAKFHGVRVSVRLPTVKDGAGVVVLYEDPDNYWQVVAAPPYSTWNIVQVTKGRDRFVGNTGVSPVRGGTVLSVTKTGTQLDISIDRGPHRVVSVVAPSGPTAVGMVADGAKARGATWTDFAAQPT